MALSAMPVLAQTGATTKGTQTAPSNSQGTPGATSPTGAIATGTTTAGGPGSTGPLSPGQPVSTSGAAAGTTPKGSSSK
jgi:hypothetical protein